MRKNQVSGRKEIKTTVVFQQLVVPNRRPGNDALKYTRPAARRVFQLWEHPGLLKSRTHEVAYRPRAPGEDVGCTAGASVLMQTRGGGGTNTAPWLMWVRRPGEMASLDITGSVQTCLDGFFISFLTGHTSGSSHRTSECFLPCEGALLPAPPHRTIAKASCRNVRKGFVTCGAAETLSQFISVCFIS